MYKHIVCTVDMDVTAHLDFRQPVTFILAPHTQHCLRHGGLLYVWLMGLSIKNKQICECAVLRKQNCYPFVAFFFFFLLWPDKKYHRFLD